MGSSLIGRKKKDKGYGALMMGALAVGGKLEINKKYNKDYNIKVSHVQVLVKT